MRSLAFITSLVAWLGIQYAAADIAALPLPSSCSGVSAMRYQYKTANGWTAVKIAGNLKQVRTIVFDPLGNMLVAEGTKGISVHTWGSNGCINSSTTLIALNSLNHGLALTPDGNTLAVSNQKTVVQGMDTGVHSSRAVVPVPSKPNMVLVQVGSNQNLDMASADKATGRAIIKIFDMSQAPASGYNYKTQGEVVAYGLRNEIGFTFDPNGVLWGVENSGDDFTRTANGARTDVHINNPSEKLNNLWDPTAFKDNTALKVGDHFVLSPNNTFNDATCNTQAVAPRLSFMPHSAPIWNAFDANATNMYVTFHGSWDRQPPTGFKVVQVPFTKLANGQYDPVAPATSTTGYSDVFSATTPESCTANGLTQSNCFRLTAATWDPAGRGLFVGSDNSAEGEIYLLSKK
ncbi:hypothetical protein TruAng_002698 [Truncatella angustata]|nr:hypothetical protein TruAng_002698 [Truncatella angustata]